MIEFYAAYDYKYLINFIEKLFNSLFESLSLDKILTYQGHDIDITKPFEKINFHNSIIKYCDSINTDNMVIMIFLKVTVKNMILIYRLKTHYIKLN